MTSPDERETDALLVVQGSIHSIGVVCAVFEFDFMGGSMGSVVGERFTRGVRVAIEQKLPFLCITATGGARMQEGLLSLMQMAKCTAALTDLAARRLPFITVLADPTMGGVFASWGSLGHITLAAPGAVVGFIGPVVYQALHGAPFPEGVQTAENLARHGVIGPAAGVAAVRFAGAGVDVGDSRDHAGGG